MTHRIISESSAYDQRSRLSCSSYYFPFCDLRVLRIIFLFVIFVFFVDNNVPLPTHSILSLVTDHLVHDDVGSTDGDAVDPLEGEADAYLPSLWQLG